jgi:hypothetical protein
MLIHSFSVSALTPKRSRTFGEHMRAKTPNIAFERRRPAGAAQLQR